MNYVSKCWRQAAFSCALLVAVLPSCSEQTPSTSGELGTRSKEATAHASTEAVRYQVLGADCGLFSPVARIPPDDEGNALFHQGRFTPTLEQAARIELALRTLPLDRVPVPAGRRIPRSYPLLIHQNLPHYKRQYFGFYNRQRQPCLYINFFPEHFVEEHPGYTPRWLRETISVDDGGAAFWSIQYNLVTHQFYAFAPNAEG